jgi:hypothetical protein
MFFDYAAFGDELSKIAKEKALYSAAVTAHEAGHSNVHAVPGVMHARIAGQLGGEVLAMQRSITAGIGPNTPETNRDAGATMALASALGNIPTLADEGVATAKALKKMKKDMSPEEYRTDRKKLLGAYGSYASQPALGVLAGLATAKVHPLAGLAANLSKPHVGGMIGRASMGIEDKKVTATQAKRIVEDIAPGTPVFATKKPMPQGSAYIPPARFGTGFMVRSATAALLKSKKDRELVAEKGGIFLAPTTDKKVKKTPDDFRRL